MINGPFYTYHRIHFTSKNASFFVIICNYPEGMYVAAATWPCAYMFQAYSQRRDFCHPPNKNKTVNLSTFASSLIFPSALLFPVTHS